MKTILVSGANKGIGLQISKDLLKCGYTVIAVSRNIENLQKIECDKLIIYKCNLLYEEEMLSLFKFLQTHNLFIDILVNNAGIGYFGSINDFNIEKWNEIMYLNLTVPFLLSKEFSKHMKENGYGKIINICSDASYLGFEDATAYCASKHALLGFGKALGIELKKYGIVVSSVCPGRVDTFFNNKKPGCRPDSLTTKDISDIIISIVKMNIRCNVESVIVSSSLE